MIYSKMHVHAQSHQSCPTLCDSKTVSCQAPQSMGFSRQEYWSGLPCLPPGYLPNPGVEPESPALQVDSLLLTHWEKDIIKNTLSDFLWLLHWNKMQFGYINVISSKVYVYIILIWQPNILRNDHHNKSGNHLHHTKLLVTWTVFFMLYLIFLWLIYNWQSVPFNSLHLFHPTPTSFNHQFAPSLFNVNYFYIILDFYI